MEIGEEEQGPEVMFANGLDPGMVYHRLDVQAWWA